MSGLCGWLGAADATLPPRARLAEMAAGLPRALDAALPTVPRAAADAAGGLFVEAESAGDDLHAEGTVWGAICGHPRWSEPGLAAIAARQGHGVALVEAWRRFGGELTARLHGHFAFAVIDRTERAALIGVDRAGVHGLCFAALPGGGIVFGTTTDAVRAHGGVGATVSSQAVFDYLYLYRVPAPRTIYAEQSKLMAAQCAEYRPGRIATRFYWEMAYHRPSMEGAEVLGPLLLAELRAALGRTLADEDPAALGAFLSGGLDSSTVTGLLAERQPDAARTFTIGFDMPRYDESGFAKIASDFFRTRHAAYFVTPDDVADIFAPLATAFDEPFGNSSAVPAYYCARFAREHGVATMLAGDGGDELFGGNARYVEMERLELYHRLPGALRRAVVEPALFGLPGTDRLPVVRGLRNRVEWARMPMPARLEKFEFMPSAPWPEMFDGDFLGQIDVGEPDALQRAVYERPKGATMLQRMMHLDLQITLADCDLRKVNGACALAGVRVRYPMLDDGVLDFAAALPSEMINPGYRLRHFYKRSMAGFLPPEVLAKRKHGFGLPTNEWLKRPGRLRDQVGDAIATLRTQRIFRPAFIDHMLNELGHAEPSRIDALLWDSAALALWLRSRKAGARKAGTRKLDTGRHAPPAARQTL